MRDTRKTYKEKVREAAEIILSEPCSPITIPQLARRLAITEKTLQRGFIEEYGRSIHNYYQDKRLEECKKMLLENLPIKQIALENGFSDKTGLIKAFRRKFNLTPKEWKKMNQVRINN
jgi:transcriptional regulator GlxA family with amidase domain